ncbi:SDR family NAD(P)-dependent oxidoreductase [Polycladidibacter hongkongensis]|uniref:SDR family NAD(P)-dependent oxidoreductase n=1 Tax=Polycladidibacter hongkongensis TaxID=1647556 RepID=UPI00082DCAB6|nr:SDR family oxidoreductase [Pseudovibrio hongkongensis]
MQQQPVIVITGGNRGIGAATARLAAKSGFAIAITYQGGEQAAQELVAELQQQGHTAIALKTDVRDQEQLQALFARASQIGPVTALVTCAGIMGVNSDLHQMEPQRIREVLDINVLGTILSARAALPFLFKNGKGAIVTVSSVAAKNGAANAGVEYAASKGAVEAFTNGLAKEVAPKGIRVNCVRPGLTRTDLHALTGDPDRINTLAPSVPLRRVAEPEEIATAIMWLVSEEASYCVGTVLEAGGGR